MSLLADLLSRSKKDGEKSTPVPPHLTSIISRATDKKKKRRKFLVTSAAVLLIVFLGVAVVYFIDPYQQQSLAPAIVSPPETVPPIATAETGTPRQGADEPSETAGSPAQPAKVDVSPEEPRTGTAAANASPASPLRAEPKASSFTAAPGTHTGATHERTGRETLDDRRKADRDAALYAAKHYEESGNLSEAIEHYKKALHLDGRNFIIMTGLSGALIKAGAYGESIQYSRLALNRNRDYVPALINLAIALVSLGNSGEGEQSLLRAHSLDPANTAALYNLALLYESQSQQREAYAMYEKMSQKDVRGTIGMARVLEKQNRLDEARKAYRDILSSERFDAATKQYANDRLVALGQ